MQFYLEGNVFSVSVQMLGKNGSRWIKDQENIANGGKSNIQSQLASAVSSCQHMVEQCHEVKLDRVNQPVPDKLDRVNQPVPDKLDRVNQPVPVKFFISTYLIFKIHILTVELQKTSAMLSNLLYSLHNGIDLLHKYTPTRASDGGAPISVTQSRVIPFV